MAKEKLGKPGLHLGVRQYLARCIPVLSRLESFEGLKDLELTSINSEPSIIHAEYTATATTSEVYRALKKSMISAGVITRDSPPTSTSRLKKIKEKDMRLYLFKEGVFVYLRVSRPYEC